MKCFRCKGNLEPAIKAINYRGKSTLINVLRCDKCEHTYADPSEVEKARLELNPPISQRIKGLFKAGNKLTEAVFSGRVL